MDREAGTIVWHNGVDLDPDVLYDAAHGTGVTDGSRTESATMRLEVERLLKQAERDLLNAARNIDIDAYEVAAFLASQAVEKYMRGVWIATRNEAPPWTHALTELGDGLGVPPDLRPKLVYLNADYTTARYPDAANGAPYEIYDRPTAESKVAAATEVFEWLRSLIRV